MSDGKRTTLKKREQLDIILSQNCRCMYCNRPLLELKVNWDHFVPHAYRAITENNWIASCRECNFAKSSTVFTKEEQIYDFIVKRTTLYSSIGDGIPKGHDRYWKILYGFNDEEIEKDRLEDTSE